jgi:hypothetical protein
MDQSHGACMDHPSQTGAGLCTVLLAEQGVRAAE